MKLPLCKTCGAILVAKGAQGYGRKMRDFRHKHHLTQEAMARALPLSRKGYQLIEYGESTPSYTTIQRFNELEARYERNQNGFSE